MPFTLRWFSLLLPGLLLCAQAVATEAGWRQVRIPGATPDAAAIVVALYYPTQAPARTIAMGPFTVRVAIQAPPDAAVKGLILLSHGIGGTELGHTTLAEALARHGYLVAALRHPGDNWPDRSLLQQSPGRYFAGRPGHVSRVLDELLRDLDWKDRIATDAGGPRVGAIGHSAGGYTVLALAGGQPDVRRIDAHCEVDRTEDPVFCGIARTVRPAPVPPSSSQSVPPLVDTRVRAVVALAPLGVVFSPESLARIRIRAAIWVAEKDRFLVPRFHAEWIGRNLPEAEIHRVPNAWHFAFMDTPGMPIASEDGDVGANPPGFDREAFLQQLKDELPAFFDKALR